MPTLTSTPLPSSLTLQLDGNHVAAADGQASVGDGTQGDQDPPPAFRWEAVKLNLPLRGAGGERGPTAHPHPRRVPRTHRHVARCPVPPPHLQPAGPVGAQLQEVELQPADSCGTPAIADTGGTVPRPGFTFPGFPQRDKAGPSQTTARTCGRDGQAHPQAGLAGQRGLAQPRRAQRQGGRGQRGPRGGSPAAAGPGQRAVGCRERRGAAHGATPRTGRVLARGIPAHRNRPATGIPTHGDPLTKGNPAHREPPRTAPLRARLRPRPHRGAPAGARPATAPHTGSTARRPHSPLARHSCKQRDGDQRGPGRHPRSPFFFPRSPFPNAHEVGGNPRAGHGRTDGRRRRQQHGGGGGGGGGSKESDGAHRAAHGREPRSRAPLPPPVSAPRPGPAPPHSSGSTCGPARDPIAAAQTRVGKHGRGFISVR